MKHEYQWSKGRLLIFVVNDWAVASVSNFMLLGFSVAKIHKHGIRGIGLWFIGFGFEIYIKPGG